MGKFYEKLFEALRESIPKTQWPTFSLNTSGYPCGTLSEHARGVDFGLPAKSQYVTVRTTHRTAFAALVCALPGSDLLDVADPRIRTCGWIWRDAQFDALPTPVRMSENTFELTLSPRTRLRKLNDWREIMGADDLNAFCVGDDPRIVIPGSCWVKHVLEHIKKKVDGYGFSCEYRPTGMYFEVHEKKFADFVEEAYGALFGLPACEVVRSQRGSAQARIYGLDIQIPGARPMMPAALSPSLA